MIPMEVQPPDGIAAGNEHAVLKGWIRFVWAHVRLAPNCETTEELITRPSRWRSGC